jgi:hypothetical protein
MKKSMLIKCGPAFAVGMAALLAGCFNSAEEGKPELKDEDGAKLETSSGGAFTKGAEILKSDYKAKAPPAGMTMEKAAAGSAWVGFVPKDPLASGCNYPTVFRFDDEDGRDNNNQLAFGGGNVNHKNYAIGGFAHTWSEWIGGGNSEVKSCQEYVSSLPALSFDYAVLSFSDNCPDGSYKFARRLDNEDYNNHNYSEGWPYPSVVSNGSNGYSWIYFCFRPSEAGAPTTPPANWASKYMLFTSPNPGSPGATLGSYYNDDEDNNNNDQWTSTFGIYSRVQAIISAGSNTRWNFASWGAYPRFDDRGSNVGTMGCFFRDPLWGSCFSN